MNRRVFLWLSSIRVRLFDEGCGQDADRERRVFMRSTIGLTIVSVYCCWLVVATSFALEEPRQSDCGKVRSFLAKIRRLLLCINLQPAFAHLTRPNYAHCVLLTWKYLCLLIEQLCICAQSPDLRPSSELNLAN